MIFSSCQKENSLTSAATGHQLESTTDADFTFSKVTIGNNKKNNNGLGLMLDYDVTIKEVSTNKYRLKIKLKGMRAAGYEFGNSKLINGVVWGVVTKINNNNEDAPLAITLTSIEKNGDTYVFPDFEYKGDLNYDLIDVSSSFRIKGGDLTVLDASTIRIGESTIGVDNGNFKKGNDFTIKEGTTVTVDQQKMETNFAILFGSAENECQLVDDGSFFLLPNGHSVEQDPKVKKVQFTKTELNGIAVDNPTFTTTGNVFSSALGLLYTPPPFVDPANPDLMIQPKAVVLVPTFSNLKKGVVRYELESADAAIYFKRADFNPDGPGWARLSFVAQ